MGCNHFFLALVSERRGREERRCRCCETVAWGPGRVRVGEVLIFWDVVACFSFACCMAGWEWVTGVDVVKLYESGNGDVSILWDAITCFLLLLESL